MNRKRRGAVSAEKRKVARAIYFAGVALCALLTLALISSKANAAELLYPIETYSENSDLQNTEGAAKARKLAKLVIKKDMATDNVRGLILSEQSPKPGHEAYLDSYQGHQAVVVMDNGWRCTVWVAINDKDLEYRMSDLISFWIRPKGTHSRDKVVTFSDRGLNGIVNPVESTIPKGQNAQDLYDYILDMLLEAYNGK